MSPFTFFACWAGEFFPQPHRHTRHFSLTVIFFRIRNMIFFCPHPRWCCFSFLLEAWLLLPRKFKVASQNEPFPWIAFFFPVPIYFFPPFSGQELFRKLSFALGQTASLDLDERCVPLRLLNNQPAENPHFRTIMVIPSTCAFNCVLRFERMITKEQDSRGVYFLDGRLYFFTPRSPYLLTNIFVPPGFFFECAFPVSPLEPPPPHSWNNFFLSGTGWFSGPVFMIHPPPGGWPPWHSIFYTLSVASFEDGGSLIFCWLFV